MNKLQEAHLKLMGWTEGKSYDNVSQIFIKNDWRLKICKETGNVYCVGIPKDNIPEEIVKTHKTLQRIQ